MKLIRTILGVAIGATVLQFYSSADIQAAETARAIEEIVVTSRRRDESQQDVPISVTAFGSERIDQIKPTTLRDFDGLAPNVYLGMNTAGPGAAALYIRGIGYADIEKTQSPQVGVIVDGIQMGSSTGQLIDTFDVESVEINRGPQGVLFGKNTIGGNIVVNRVKPQFDEFTANASIEFGNYSAENYKLRVNLPLVDDALALKIGVIKREREGYYDNRNLGGTAGDINFEAFTTALRWAPADNFSVIATYDKIDDKSQTLPQDPRFDGSNRFINLADKREPTIYDVDQLGINATWDLGDNHTLYSVTGLHRGADLVNQDFDGGGVDGLGLPFAQLHTLRDQELEVFTQEFRLAGAFTEDLDYMMGYYYYESELDFIQTTNNILQLANLGLVPFGLAADGSTPCSSSPLQLRAHPAIGDNFCQFPNARSVQSAGEDVESTAIFGSLTWRPMEQLEVAVGFRNIQEDKEARNSYVDYSNRTFDADDLDEFDFSSYMPRQGNRYAGGDDWSKTIWTASVNYAFTEANRVYASYSEGFRSGGFSIRSARSASEATFDPETAEQIEIGTKNEFMDGALLLNLAWYQIELNNGQFSSIITLPPESIPGTTTIINNGTKSTLDGWEFEGRWLINDNFTLSFNYGTVNADNAAFTLPCDIVDGCAAGPGMFDPSGTLRNLGGHGDSRQPEDSVSVNLFYVREMAAGVLYLNTGYKHVGEFLLVNTGAGHDQRTFDGEYSSWDARIAYDIRMDNDAILSLSLYGKNLRDEEWREQALFLGSGTEVLPSGGPNTGFQGWGAPRTYAFEVRYSM